MMKAVVFLVSWMLFLTPALGKESRMLRKDKNGGGGGGGTEEESSCADLNASCKGNTPCCGDLICSSKKCIPPPTSAPTDPPPSGGCPTCLDVLTDSQCESCGGSSLECITSPTISSISNYNGMDTVYECNTPWCCPVSLSVTD